MILNSIAETFLNNLGSALVAVGVRLLVDTREDSANSLLLALALFSLPASQIFLLTYLFWTQAFL